MSTNRVHHVLVEADDVDERFLALARAGDEREAIPDRDRDNVFARMTADQPVRAVAAVQAEERLSPLRPLVPMGLLEGHVVRGRKRPRPTGHRD